MSDHSLLERFHSVQSVLPADQQIVTISPNASIAEALDKLAEYPFSQLVVVEGKEVFGLFSYRSFAQKIHQDGDLKTSLEQLSVDDYMEQVDFAQPTSSWEKLLNAVERDDVALVGSDSNLLGVVTPMDFTLFLKRIADPFVVIAEIEQALRDAITAVASPEQLKQAAIEGLGNMYPSHDQVPTDLTEMTFNQYIQIINNGKNWPLFAKVFGDRSPQRGQTFRALKAVNDLRNDAFHFKRELTNADMAVLQKHRKWLRRRLRMYVAANPSTTPAPQQRSELDSTVDTTEGARFLADLGLLSFTNEDNTPSDDSSADNVSISVQRPESGQWTEEAFFAKLAENTSSDEVNVARKLYKWALTYIPDIWWGKGKKIGSVIPGLPYNGVWHQLFGIYTSGHVEIQLQYMQKKPPFDDLALRRKLIQQLNQLDGVNIAESQINSRPSIRLHQLVDETQQTKFLQAAQWFVDTATSSKPQSTKESYTQFWAQLLEKARQQSSLHARAKAGNRYWSQANAGKTSIAYNYVLLKNSARIELYIDRSNAAENKSILNQLQNHQAEIEAAFGDSLVWKLLEGRRASKIEYPIAGGGLYKVAEWGATQDKMVDAMVRFSKTLQPYIDGLDF